MTPPGIKPTVDFVFKKVFGSQENSVALIGLLNAILKPADRITDVEILNPFSYQDFAEDKLVVLDVRARDARGRWLNVEMQVAVAGGLVQRLVYYACSLFIDQLGSGGRYRSLKPAISICLLNGDLFADSGTAHHRFRLCDPDQGRELRRMLEIHTVELMKYNLEEGSIGAASEIQQWAFFLLHADQFGPEQLRGLLPGAAFRQAITVIEEISRKTEDRAMYDQREKAQRDHQWAIESSREDGLEEGLERGLEKGLEKGREEGREEGVDVGMLVGKVQLIQGLLGDDESPVSQLRSRTTGELSAKLAELQERLRARGV